jgi:hypothetical protein
MRQFQSNRGDSKSEVIQSIYSVLKICFCMTPTVNCPSQETEVTSTLTRPIDNVIATKGLQDRNKYNSWDDGGK